MLSLVQRGGAKPSQELWEDYFILAEYYSQTTVGRRYSLLRD